MPVTIKILQQRMEEAVAALDFEEASRCRDMINAMRGGATAVEAEAARFEGLTRQEPGAMGLGTSQQKRTPPAGWRPPARPDPMTAGRSRHGRKRKG
ncbi:UvrB/UvrC motif-containing protein [Sphingomonas pituitosa]|uniref:UvrB/UvrC motif-containing protein n=1 Tax=Sphingomonas pituitosa TaxID=99597 RepID=UPI000831C02A|nr:UvrB/UvrC motif-containing protein [Sphingomonas pituitosa]